MAKQSEKKLEQTRQEKIGIYRLIALGATAISLLNFLIRGNLFTFAGIAPFLGMAFVDYMSVNQINRSLGLGVDYDTTIDIYVVNVFVQVTSCIHDYFYYVYLVVPGYGLYKLLGFVWAYIGSSSSGSAGATPEEDDKSSKKKDKQAKEKVKYKTVRK